MAAKRRPKVPQALLIYCEGKTEEAYFNILLDIFRLPRYVKVEVSGQRGQHLALIDNAVKERSRFCEAEGLDTEEAECWAVCDDDGMTCSYTELERYSEERDVHLAFARPQFESFLLQHFEQSGETDICEIFHRLTVHRNENGGAGAYDDSTKADLAWLANAINSKPKIVKTAITNSGLRGRTTKSPFLTVQSLAERFIELQI